MLQFISHGDDALPLAQADPEKPGQGGHHLDRLRLFFIFHHPDDDIQGIVEEMGIDLGLERVKFSFPLRLMLLHDILHQYLDLAGHVRDGPAQVLDLIGASDIDRHIQLPILQLAHRSLQLMDRIGDLGGDIEIDHQKEE